MASARVRAGRRVGTGESARTFVVAHDPPLVVLGRLYLMQRLQLLQLAVESARRVWGDSLRVPRTLSTTSWFGHASSPARPSGLSSQMNYGRRTGDKQERSRRRQGKTHPLLRDLAADYRVLGFERRCSSFCAPDVLAMEHLTHATSLLAAHSRKLAATRLTSASRSARATA